MNDPTLAHVLREGLFERIDLSPGCEDYPVDRDLVGTVGLTHDLALRTLTHKLIYALQISRRLFSGYHRRTNPRHMHGFVVLSSPVEDPEGACDYAHSNPHGGIITRHRVDHLNDRDDGCSLWRARHAGVRHWTARCARLICSDEAPGWRHVGFNYLRAIWLVFSRRRYLVQASEILS